MGFKQTPLPIGTYEIVAGTSGNDNLTGIGGQAVFAGGGNDQLTGNSVTTTDGYWQVSPLLSGGAGDDTYTIRNGTWNYIADLNGGKDLIKTSLNLRNIYFARINNRDILATDGSTAAILIDPLGAENSNNKIEAVQFGRKKYSAEKLYKMATSSKGYLGSFTYADLEDEGILNLSIMGLNSSRINEYIDNGRFNNSIVA